MFLDELGTLSMAAQDRLLRAVEYGEITRIVVSRPLRVDVRIVAATNEHLPDRVEKGTFRADLLDRLSFEVVTLSPLRARGGGDRQGMGWIGPAAFDALTAYHWPDNVRELRNAVERAVYRWERADPVDAVDCSFASPYRLAAMPHGIPDNSSPRATRHRGVRTAPAAGGGFKSRVNRRGSVWD